MPRKLVLLVAAASAGFASTAAADPFLPVPPASFINYHVDTVHQLSQQVAYDTVVRGRLARHFHLAGPDMVSYIENNLVLSYLKTAAPYRVACVTPSGHEYYINARLPKGTAVFALASTGQPILKRACGNPLVSSLPAVTPKPASHVARKPVGQPALAETTTTTQTPETLVASSTVPGDTTLAEVPDLTGTDVGDLGPFSRVAGSIASIGGGGGGFGLPLAGLAALGAAGLFGGHHGSSGSSTTTAPTSPVTPTPPITPVAPVPPGTPVAPAPEPGAGLVYGIGFLGLMALGIKRRRAGGTHRG